jgi:DNA invertase Pin-like site-specific DNA recombinase
MAAVAEDEARRIRQRTKDAVAAYKARGGVLGAVRPECRNLTDEARRRGARGAGIVARKNAKAAYEDVSQTVRSLDSNGHSLRSVAKRLNAEGHTTRRGRARNAFQVRQILNAPPGSESLME